MPRANTLYSCVCVYIYFLLYNPSSHSNSLSFLGLVLSISVYDRSLIHMCVCVLLVSLALAIFGWITSVSIVMSSLVMKIQKLCAIIYWNIIEKYTEYSPLSDSIMEIELQNNNFINSRMSWTEWIPITTWRKWNEEQKRCDRER